MNQSNGHFDYGSVILIKYFVLRWSPYVSVLFSENVTKLQTTNTQYIQYQISIEQSERLRGDSARPLLCCGVRPLAAGTSAVTIRDR